MKQSSASSGVSIATEKTNLVYPEALPKTSNPSVKREARALPSLCVKKLHADEKAREDSRGASVIVLLS